MKTFFLPLLAFFLLTVTNTFAQDAAPSDDPKATIEFTENEFDFGIIESGEKVSHTYTFTNTSDVPLVLTNAKGSCGCTVPSWPKEPIMPGEQASIEVTFNSKNKKGKQSKRVTITANTDPAQTFLTIKGEVTPAKTDLAEEKAESKASPRTADKKWDTNEMDCFAIYPNPTSDELRLDINDHMGESATIKIFSESGKLLDNKVIDRVDQSVIRFDVSKYSAGHYIASIQFGNEKPVAKCFVVTK